MDIQHPISYLFEQVRATSELEIVWLVMVLVLYIILEIIYLQLILKIIWMKATYNYIVLRIPMFWAGTFRYMKILVIFLRFTFIPGKITGYCDHCT